MLRRLKADIQELNLPKRIVKEVQCEFENMERDTYESLATRVEKSLNRAAQVRDLSWIMAHIYKLILLEG